MIDNDNITNDTMNELTDNERLALEYALSELSNSGDWSYYAELDGNGDDVSKVLEGSKSLREKFLK